MKLFNSGAVIFFLIFFQMSGFGYTRIYLLSEVEINRDNLIVSDICKMEGDDIGLISNLVISPGLYGDSIVDNKELYDFLSISIDKKIFIFGTGVKVKKNIAVKDPVVTKTVLVEKGEFIELSVRKNGITIEVKGKALNSGSEKDEIDFRLLSGKVIKAKITSSKKADIIL